MVERPPPASGIVTAAGVPPRFFVEAPFAANATVTIGEDAARHMRVLRIGAGAEVVLLDGEGGRALGTLRKLSKRNATVEMHTVERTPPLPAVHALVPVADRERMLWLAEKLAEVGVTTWRPVSWKRSRSVSPRGAGSGFQIKVRARMASALEQSGNTWLPVTHPDSTIDRAISAVPGGARFVFDQSGAPFVNALAGVSEPVSVAIGPEGGFEGDELEILTAAGFTRASLGPTVLRFETAGLVGVAYLRAILGNPEHMT